MNQCAVRLIFRGTGLTGRGDVGARHVRSPWRAKCVAKYKTPFALSHVPLQLNPSGDTQKISFKGGYRAVDLILHLGVCALSLVGSTYPQDVVAPITRQSARARTTCKQ